MTARKSLAWLNYYQHSALWEVCVCVCLSVCLSVIAILLATVSARTVWAAVNTKGNILCFARHPELREKWLI